ncbi:unnamed protein product [Heligmosomoides polygyrus]|uniref:ATP-synt_DE_N domain-containing protein n=1 Tax=Heligmosomoides polygyrus TaxID=6339 RepID=A0A183G4Z5_HELPZ|nr:unnamed protein product [Heligmosomoides polygyrus]
MSRKLYNYTLNSTSYNALFTVRVTVFEEAHTYGVTALMCIVTAMGVLQKMPPFDIAPLLPVSRLVTMTPAQVIFEVCEYAGQPFVTLSKL